MSTIKYSYKQNFSFVKKGVKNTIKEQVIDGDKGLSLMFLKKEGDAKFYKVYVKEEEKDKFIVKEKKDDKETEKTVDMKELTKMLKTLKLDTITNYVTKERGTYKGKRV